MVHSSNVTKDYLLFRRKNTKYLDVSPKLPVTTGNTLRKLHVLANFIGYLGVSSYQ